VEPDEHAVRGAWRAGPGETTVLVGDDGLIVMGAGESLRPDRTGPVPDLYAVAGSWAAGTDGSVLFRDMDGGWHALPKAGSGTFLSLALLVDGRVLAGGTHGVYLGDARGWRPLDWPEGTPRGTVFALKAWDRRAVAVGADGLVLAFDGKALSALPAPGGESLYGVAGGGPDGFLAVGAEGAAYERKGDAWVPVPVAGGEDLMAVSDAGVAVGAMGGIYRFGPDAAAWHTLTPPGAFGLYAVADDPEGATWAVGDAGAVRYVTGDAVRDVAVPTGRTLRGVSVAPDGRVTLVGDGGAVLERPPMPGEVALR
jgi:ligand-binding sensor domain-containing protein